MSVSVLNGGSLALESLTVAGAGVIGGGVQSVLQSGNSNCGVLVDNTDPTNPLLSANLSGENGQVIVEGLIGSPTGELRISLDYPVACSIVAGAGINVIPPTSISVNPNEYTIESTGVGGSGVATVNTFVGSVVINGDTNILVGDTVGALPITVGLATIPTVEGLQSNSTLDFTTVDGDITLTPDAAKQVVIGGTNGLVAPYLSDGTSLGGLGQCPVNLGSPSFAWAWGNPIASAGGATTNVQFNSAGALGGTADMTTDGAGTLTVSAKVEATEFSDLPSNSASSLTFAQGGAGAGLTVLASVNGLVLESGVGNIVATPASTSDALVVDGVLSCYGLAPFAAAAPYSTGAAGELPTADGTGVWAWAEPALQITYQLNGNDPQIQGGAPVVGGVAWQATIANLKVPAGGIVSATCVAPDSADPYLWIVYARVSAAGVWQLGLSAQPANDTSFKVAYSICAPPSVAPV